MHRFVRWMFVLAAVVGLIACSSPDDDTTDPDAGTQDTAETDTDDTDDAVDDTGDADDAEDVDDEGCTYQSDCADDEYCHDEECRAAPECPNTNAWQLCVDEFEQVDDGLARRAHCDGEYCRVACLTDEECPDGQLCTDDGGCIPFTGELTGEHPGGDESAPLEAGVGTAALKFPIGMSLGGYGSRAASDDGRYVESLSASHGKMHELQARGVALDDGERQLVFLRAPIIFPSGALHEGVSRILQDETGSDWRHSLVISGTHTHSGPARFWQLPDPDTVEMPMGMLGIGEFHQQQYEWLVESLADAALNALDDLSPAQMGWEVVESFDVDDVISSDRRGQTPPFDDNRVLLLRIDDADGAPRAVLFSFGTHGTVHSGPYANDDVLVGAEKKLEYALGDTFDRHVPVMYFNQNGGTMSPRGGGSGHDHTQRFERLGAHLVDRTFEAIEQMETTDDWSLSGHTHRFPIVHEYLGYEEGEFPQDIYGGLMCPADVGSDYADHTDPHDYDCGLLGLHTLLGHRPMTLISKSQISALQLNDLTLVTMPGELAMPLGWQVQRELRDEYGIDPFDSFTWGYAQDHLLYLLPTNLRGELPPFPGISTPQAPDEYPEYAFSYLQGGYEADMSPWGHNLGDYLVDRALEAVGILLGEVDEPQFGVPYPDEFTPRDQESFPVDASDSDDVGVVTDQPPAEVERRDIVEVAWLGGDPGAEMPQAPRATLERLDDGEFSPVELRNHRPYDNREFAMLTRLRRDEDDRYEWVVYWEELADFPTGTYRFNLEGHYLDDGGDRQPYQVSTDEFELVPSTKLTAHEFEFVDDSTLSMRLSHPGAEELFVSAGGDDPGELSGSYRMHHPDVPTGVSIPVDPEDLDVAVDVERSGPGAPISADAISVEAVDQQIGGYDVPTTRVVVDLDGAVAPGAELDVDVTATDRHDNTATENRTVEFSP